MRFSWTLAAAALLFTSGCTTVAGYGGGTRAERLRDQFLTRSNGVMVVAHRTCWRETTENSVSGINACVALGVDMVEIDVRRTADGVLVLMHDETVDRTTNGAGKVEQLHYADFAALRLRARAGGPDAALTEEAPPTLEAALIAARGRILVNLDMKADLYEEALAIAERVGAEDSVLIKAYLAPGDVQLGFTRNLGRTLFMPVFGQCAAPGARAYCPASGREAVVAFNAYPSSAYEVVFLEAQFFQQAAAAAHRLNRRAWANTLQPGHAAGMIDADAVRDPAGVWGRLIDLGADIIQTDNPRELMAYLEARGEVSSVGQRAH
jgi:glycerophosphoryl diester phosphodiesterase